MGDVRTGPGSGAAHAGRFGPELGQVLRVERARRLDRLADDLVERDLLLLERAALVEPRKQKQVVNEQAHPLRLAADARHRSRENVGAARSTAREELRV